MDKAATLERVEKAARMLSSMLRDAAPDLPADSFTFVVDNFEMKATLRAQNDAGAAFLREVIHTARDPFVAVRERVRSRAIARGLAHVARGFADEKPSLRARGARKELKLDSIMAKAFDAAAKVEKSEDPLAPALSGASEIRSAVLRVGRTNEASPLRARIILDGAAAEVDVHRDAIDSVLEALKVGGPHALTIRSKWLRDDTGAFEADKSSIVVMGAAPAKLMRGAALLSDAPKLSQESFAAIMDLLRETRGDDD